MDAMTKTDIVFAVVLFAVALTPFVLYLVDR